MIAEKILENVAKKFIEENKYKGDYKTMIDDNYKLE
jgi:hypothetical protein